MHRRESNLPQWVQEEVRRISAMQAQPKLEALWALCGKLAKSDDCETHIIAIKQMIQSAQTASRLDFILLGFGEIRRLYATDPRYAHLRKDVLWYFKWLVEDLPENADVPIEKLDEVFREAESFYVQEKESLRPLYSIRCQSALHMGRPEEAREWFEKWQDAPQGKSDDCPACEADRLIQYHLENEETEAAMIAANPILEGKVWCNETPITLARLLRHLLQSDRRKLAFAILKATQKQVRKEPRMLYALGAHVLYMSLSLGAFNRSRRLAGLCLHHALEAQSDLDRFNAYRAVGMWSAVAVIAGKHDLVLNSKLFPGDTSARPMQMPEVAAACFEQARAIARKLDSRNGNDRYMKRMKEMEEMIEKSLSKLSEIRRSNDS